MIIFFQHGKGYMKDTKQTLSIGTENLQGLLGKCTPSFSLMDMKDSFWFFSLGNYENKLS